MKVKFCRMISIILALSMVVVAFAGCGETETTSTKITSEESDVDLMDDVDVDLNLGGNDDTQDDTSNGSSGNTSSGSSGNITTVDNTDIFKNIPKELQGTTVTIAHWGDEGAAEYLKVQKKFTKDTKIKVKWQLINEGNYVSTIVKQIAAGTGPDIVISNNTFPTDLEAVQPLPKYFDLNDGFWDKRVSEAMSAGGKYYFVNSYSSPFACTSRLVYYNKKIFNDNGITTPEDYVAQGKWTYENLIKCMQQVKKIGKSGGVIEAMILAGQMGASMIEYDPKSSKFTANTKNEDLITAIQWFSQACTEGIAGNLSVNDFATGQVGICVTGHYGLKYNGYFKDMSPSHIGVVALPTSYQGKKLEYTPAPLRAYGIARGAKNPHGAYYFLRYFLDFDKYAEAGANIFANKVMEKFYVKELLPNFKNQKLYFEYYDHALRAVGKAWNTNDWTYLRHAASGQVAVELNKMANICSNAANEANKKIQSFTK